MEEKEKIRKLCFKRCWEASNLYVRGSGESNVGRVGQEVRKRPLYVVRKIFAGDKKQNYFFFPFSLKIGVLSIAILKT